MVFLYNFFLFVSIRANGGDLQTYLDAEEYLEESHCIEVLKDTLKGLQFLHSHSIAHLDLKVGYGLC